MCMCVITLFHSSRISLNVMTLKVTSTHVNSVQGVPISVTGIAQVRKRYYLILEDCFIPIARFCCSNFLFSFTFFQNEIFIFIWNKKQFLPYLFIFCYFHAFYWVIYLWLRRKCTYIDTYKIPNQPPELITWMVNLMQLLWITRTNASNV